jgi:hypothetical protein
MKHLIKDIPCDGEIIEIHDEEIDKEWSDWYKRKEENPTDEIYNEGKLICDKIRKKYGITTCIRVGHLKDKKGQLAMTVSDIPAEDTFYHPSDGTYVKKVLNK